MSESSDSETLRVLARVVSEGGSANELLPLVYDELRAIARRQRRNRSVDDTLRTTALVHDVYLKLAGTAKPDWKSRAHFLAVAAKAVRQVLCDYARERRALKRGDHWQRVTLSAVGSEEATEVDLVAVDEALEKLARIDEPQSRLVEMRFLAGMSLEETAEVLGLSTRTVERRWRAARAWLSVELKGTGS